MEDNYSEENESAVREILYLLGIPGMKKSIQEGLETPLEECEEELEW